MSIGTDTLLVGFVNYLVVWATVSMLGYAWLDGRLAGTGRRLLLAAVGAIGVVALVWAGPYPVSMIGLDGAAVNNSYPTRVTMLFLGMLQGGVVLALEPLLSRWMQRPRAWTATVLVNTRIMTLYLWHLTVMVLVIGVSLLLGGAGLRRGAAERRVVGDAAAVVGRAGPRHRRIRRSPRAVRDAPARRLRASPGLAARRSSRWSACGGLGLMAAQGVVAEDGVHWWWPVLTVAAVGLLLVSRERGPRQRLRVDDGEAGDGAGQHDVEATQAGALVGLGRRDLGGLEDEHVVELQPLGDGAPGTTSTWWSTSPWVAPRVPCSMPARGERRRAPRRRGRRAR